MQCSDKVTGILHVSVSVHMYIERHKRRKCSKKATTFGHVHHHVMDTQEIPRCHFQKKQN